MTIRVKTCDYFNRLYSTRVKLGIELVLGIKFDGYESACRASPVTATLLRFASDKVTV